MNEELQALINALRDELQQYGEMLALLDQQQDFVLRRAADDLLVTVSGVNSQGTAIQMARRQRETCRRRVATALGLPEGAGFAEILPKLPEDYRPLLQALVEENNELLVRVQQRARQNHLLLSRSLELMQRFLSSLFAPGSTQTYNGNGALLPGGPVSQPLYQAVI
jgi:flagellar biosynthesis/type III secretory pathway chaperone